MPAGQPLTGAGNSPQQPDGGYPRYAGYTGPPATAAHDPGIAAQPAYPYPPGYPSSGDPHPAEYPYLSGYGYPGPPVGDRRPGSTTAAAVLGYVTAGLLVIAAMVVFTGASLVSGIDATADGVNLDRITVELTFDGFLNLLAAGLFIGGGVLMSMRRPAGRVLYTFAAGIVVVEAIYWLGRWASLIDNGDGVTFYAVLFGALAVIGSGLAWTRAATAWLAAAPSPPPGSPPHGPSYGAVPPW